MKRISGIYKITNIINNKSYVGSSVDICTRWREHKRHGIKNCCEGIANTAYGYSWKYFE